LFEVVEQAGGAFEWVELSLDREDFLGEVGLSRTIGLVLGGAKLCAQLSEDVFESGNGICGHWNPWVSWRS
jgi:hypothetical protein